MTTKPNIVRGGKAINIGKRLYYIDGKPHELGGVDIGRNLEVEGGEVVEVKDKGLRVYSAQPILNGKSPAQLVMGGIEPDSVFNAQERFKDANNLNDDGTKKKSMGGLSRSKDYGSKKKPYPNVDKKDFAGGGRSYPIPTKADAIDALRLAGLHGRSDVKAKVYKKYPELKKRVGGTVSVNGNVIDKLLFASPSTGDKKKAKLGTGEPGKNPPIIYRDSIVPPVYGMPSIASVRRLTYPNSDVLKITDTPIYSSKSSNYPSVNIKTPEIKYYDPIIVRKHNSIDNSIEGIDYNHLIYPNVVELNKIESSPSNKSIIDKTLPSSNNSPSNLKIDTAPYTPYQWDDTQFSITPGSISKAETNRALRGSLHDNGGYDPIEEGIMQIHELGTGKSGTPEGFKWNEYTNPADDESNVNRVPRTKAAEKALTDWGFTPNKIYKQRGIEQQVEEAITNNDNNNIVVKPSNSVPRRGTSSSTSASIKTSRSIPTISDSPISPLATIEPTILPEITGIKSIETPTYTANNKTSDGLVRGSFKDITPEDWIGFGGNLASSVASYFIGSNRPSIDLVEPSRPVMEQPVRMVTKYNNRPELANIRESVKRSMDDIASNTSSSRAALQRMQRVRNAGTQAINESEAKKQNIETQLKNADAANRQSVRARNVSTYNKYLADKQNIKNRQRLIDAERKTGKLQNTIGLVTNVNNTLQDLLTRIEQRRKFNNSLGYLQSTAPNVDDRIMRDNNVDFNYLRTVGG